MNNLEEKVFYFNTWIEEIIELEKNIDINSLGFKQLKIDMVSFCLCHCLHHSVRSLCITCFGQKIHVVTILSIIFTCRSELHLCCIFWLI